MITMQVPVTDTTAVLVIHPSTTALLTVAIVIGTWAHQVDMTLNIHLKRLAQVRG